MIDFTSLPRRNKSYAGANGSKIAVVYNDELYMLKFPGTARLNQEMSYANGCISEFLGSHVFALAGIPVQDTLLGTYRVKGKKKIVVACRDFTGTGLVLQDFTSMKNTVLDSDSNGTGTELQDILEAIERFFDARPGAIISSFGLNTPTWKYADICNYGVFGRPDVDLPWERLDKVEGIKAFFKGHKRLD